MERRTSRHTRKAKKDLALAHRLCDKFQKVISSTQEELEDISTKLEDAEIKLEEFREMYCIPAPRSLTEEMELEERLRL